MNPQSIYHYRSAKRFLLDSVAKRQKFDTEFSVRKWSKSMGVSHALVVMILQAKGSLTLKQAPLIARGLNLTTPESLYFQALVQYENASSDEERNLCQLWLNEVSPAREQRIREVDEYLVIAHWVHMAILALSDTKHSWKDAEEIQRRLGKVVPIHEIRAAVERLKEMKLLEERDGKWRCTYERVTTRDDVANRGAREYHKQVASLAPKAIEAQSVDEREFQSFAVSVPRSKIKLAKEMIRKFRTEFYEAMTSEPGDEVYQTNIHFFRLTESPSEMVPKVDAGADFKPSNAKELGEVYV